MILILACDLAALGRSVWTTVPLLTVTFVYAYLRYTRGLRLVLWFLNLFLFEVLLALALGMESIPELPLYLTLTTLAWAFGSVRLRDPLTAAHRTLILWCLAFVTAGLLLVLSLKTVSVLHPQLWLGLGFTAVSLVVAARRSRSSWPIYLTLVLLGIPGLRLKTELGFANGSGLSQVLVGGLLLAPSHQFRLRAVDWHISHGSALLERGTRP